MARIMKKYSILSDKLKKGFESTINSAYYKLTHPGVPIAGIFSTVVPTEESFYVADDPRKWTDQN